MSDAHLHLDLRNADAALSWPEHERRKRLGLRRLHNMLEADADADVGSGSEAEAKAETPRSTE